MLKNVPPARLMRIAAIAATIFVVLNIAIGRYWWALAFGVLALMWFATGRSIDRRGDK
jgi:hypothetical protein